MIIEIITKSNQRFRKNDGKTKSIKWNNKFNCFQINNKINVYLYNIKSLTFK